MSKFALVIANTKYTDPGLAQLSAPGKDAEDFARVLKSQEICAFEDVKVFLNEPEPVIREAIDEFFSQKKPDDLLVLYFSGHGVRDENGSLYLAVTNTNRFRLRSTAVKSDFIRESMDQSRSKRQVLILDCCNSGAFAQGTKAATGGSVGTASAFEGTGYGHVVLTASDSTQFAWEGDQVIGATENSLFTHFLVKGLDGEADRNGDGRITIDELYDYAYEQIVRVTPKQTPSKWSYKEQGEITLRQSTRIEDIKPVSLPEELVNEIESLYPEVRLRAVQGLVKLLNSKNLGLVRSAREGLERMAAEDDSRRVAQAAIEVLDSLHQAEQLAKQKAEEERLAREKVEAERKAEDERLAREQAEHEATEKAIREEAQRLVAERIAKEQAEREEAQRLAAEKAAKEKAEREEAEKAVRELAEQEAQRLAAEKVAKEKAEREAAEKDARELAEREVVQKLVAEKAAKEKAEREDAEKDAREQAEREEAQQLDVEKATKEKAERELVEKVAVEEAQHLAAEKAVEEKADHVAFIQQTQQLVEEASEAGTRNGETTFPWKVVPPRKNLIFAGLAVVAILIIASILVIGSIENEKSLNATSTAFRISQNATNVANWISQDATSTAQSKLTATAKAIEDSGAISTAQARAIPTEKAYFSSYADVFDSFDKNSSNWWTGNLDSDYYTGVTAIADGTFQRKITKAKKSFGAWSSYPGTTSDNFNVKVDARRISGTIGKISYGIVFRASQDRGHYVFRVQDDGFYTVGYYNGTESTALVAWTGSPAIKINDWNTLRVSAKGGDFNFYINGILVDKITDHALSSGEIAFYISCEIDESGEVHFDNFYLIND